MCCSYLEVFKNLLEAQEVDEEAWGALQIRAETT